MKHEWIMKKGNWTDHAAFQRYLTLNNRNTELTFESAMSRDINHTLERSRSLEFFYHRIRSILEEPLGQEITGEQFRSSLLAIFKAHFENCK